MAWGLLFALIALLAPPLHADEPTTRPADADEPLSAAVVTIQLKQAHPRVVFEELGRQLGIELRVASNLWESKEWDPIDIDLEGASLWEAMELITARTGLSLQRRSVDQDLVVTKGSVVPWTTAPRSIHGPFLVTARHIQGTHVLHPHAPDDVTRNYSIRMTFFAEPNVKVLRGRSAAIIDEAVDENGNSLIGQLGEPPSTPLQSASGWGWPCTASLSTPAGAGRRIRQMKGSLRIAIQIQSESVEVDDILQAENVSRDLAGRTLLVKQVRQHGDTYMVSAELRADPANLEEWSGINLSGTIRLLDADGNPLTQRIFGPAGTRSGVVSLNLMFGRDDRGGGPQAGEPAKLVWELPTELKELIIPFEFTDLPLP